MAEMSSAGNPVPVGLSREQEEAAFYHEAALNTYKPFACGIVIHPVIDGCAQLKARGVTPEQVQRIELKVHPLVLELTGNKEPADGLQGKFSVYHGAALGLMIGRAGETEYSDAIVTRPDIVALRRKVVAVVDQGIAEESADVTAILADGRREQVFVEHAIGSLQRPMSDAQLESKFGQLVSPVLGSDRVASLIAACRALPGAGDLRVLTAAACAG